MFWFVSKAKYNELLGWYANLIQKDERRAAKIIGLLGRLESKPKDYVVWMSNIAERGINPVIVKDVSSCEIQYAGERYGLRFYDEADNLIAFFNGLICFVPLVESDDNAE